MEYSNDHDIPEIVEKWLLNDEYDYVEGVLSATTLMQPPRITVLKERYRGKMVMDIADLIAMRYGTAIHASFEKVDFGPDVRQEERLFATINGHKISGKYDILKRIERDLYKLMDIKSTSVWNYIYDNKTDDYTTQLSIYRYILEMNEVRVDDEAEVIMVFTDWAKTKAKQDPSYPQIRLKIKKIPLWDMRDTEEWLRDRLQVIVSCRELPDDELPFCTDEELWKQADKYAVMREGRKSAVRVLDIEEEAEFMAKDDPKGYVEVRKGVVKRCPTYCNCHPFCNQYKKLKEEGYIDE